MRPVGREKTAYKPVKKGWPVRGILISIVSVLAAGWLFSLVTVRPEAAPGIAAANVGAPAVSTAETAPGDPSEASQAAEQAPESNGSEAGRTAAAVSEHNAVTDQDSAAPADPGSANAAEPLQPDQDPAEAERVKAERAAKEKVWRAKKDTGDATYIGNARSGKFHYPGCFSVTLMNWENVVFFYGGRDELINLNYVPCKLCHP